eukprot:Hpha_TRINITY_DN15354_c1_g6::TRINITY_DN15354_c1_g6_i1::g.90491::m.90491/K05643/ABCA3; ATP-binding cassette, subfamily A (ABC1), member 3
MGAEGVDPPPPPPLPPPPPPVDEEDSKPRHPETDMAPLLKVRSMGAEEGRPLLHFRLAVGKTLLLKRRKPGSTLCEVLLPGVFVSLLLIGYFLSDTEHNPPENFAEEGFFNMTEELTKLLCIVPPWDESTARPNTLGLKPCQIAPGFPYNCSFGITSALRIMNLTGGAVVCADITAQINEHHLIHLVTQASRPASFLPFDAMVVLQKIADRVLGQLKINQPSVENSLLHSGSVLVALDDHIADYSSACSAAGALLSRIDNSTMTFGSVLRSPDFPAGAACPGVWRSEKDATGAAHKSSRERPTWAVVVLKEVLPEEARLGVSIRLNYTATPPTRWKESRRRGMSQEYLKYTTSGFLSLEHAFYNAFVEGLSGSLPDSPLLPGPEAEIPFPTAAYDESTFLDRAGGLIPLVLAFAFIYPVSRIVSGVVEEKELRLREGVLIMGLTKSSFYGSWVFVAGVTTMLSSFVMTILMITTFLSKTSFFLLYLLVLEYGLTMVTLGMLTTVFFSRARIAAVAGPLVVVLFVIPQFAVPNDLATSSQMSMSLLSPTPFSIAFTNMCEDEQAGEGADFSDMNRNDFPYSFALFILAVDTVLYLLLFLYLDVVLPSEYGVRRHPLFFLFPSYWMGSADPDGGAAEEAGAEEAQSGRIEEECGGEVRVRIQNLTKVFRGAAGKVTAVDNLNLRFREGRVQVVLGHNGAGKTTLFNMLTGLLPPTSGDCKVWGTSVAKEVETVRKDLGLCPQHNILWPTLTCMEHLRFYGEIKGLSRRKVDELALLLLELVGLQEKKDAASSTLSGGQKRKLSVAIALIGGARLVFFDEPTAGMDVGARRNLWNLLKRREILEGRVVVLTTHYMDEADILGDSIAIMQAGQLHSWGSPLFLKNALGVGYYLTATARADGSVSNVRQIVRKHLGSERARLVSETKNDVKMSLNRDNTEGFPDLFRELDRVAEDEGFDYGVGLTTLEEVFMRIAEERTIETADLPQAPVDSEPILELADASDRTTGWRLVLQQFVALVLKRFHYAKRDQRTLFFQFVMPVLFIALALLLRQIGPPNQPERYLDVRDLDCPCEFFASPLDGPFVNASIGAPLLGYPANDSGGLSQFLLDNYNAHKGKHRHLAFVAPDRVFDHNHTLNATGGTNVTATILHNSTSLHALATGTVMYHAAVLRKLTGNPSASFTVSNHPLPISDYEQELLDNIKVVITGIFVMIPFSLLPSNFVGFVVREKADKVKHLQLVSGLNVWCYWAANFTFDFCSYLVSVALALIIFAADGKAEFTSQEAIGATITLFTLYGAAAVTTSYVLSFVFASHTAAQNAVMAFNVVCGFLLVIAAQLLDLFDTTKDVNHVLKFFYRLVPSYCLGEGIISLSILPLQGIANDAFGYDLPGSSPWAWKVTSRNDVYLASIAPIAMALALSFDVVNLPRPKWGWWRKTEGDALSAPLIEHEEEDEEEDDDDVARERREVLSGSRQGDVVEVRELQKVYSNGTRAVRGVTFSVKKGEVFAFLGANGAGKTTTIGTMTGEVNPTSGSVMVAGHDVATEPEAARRGVGLCPQFDALLDLLTVDETLTLFARLRGLPSELARRERETLIAALGLAPFRRTVCKALSGGNRRKLSLAVSLTGTPQLSLLDEPSAGMDPQARRELWKVVGAAAKVQGRSVVLTTHHLEEVEALSSGPHRVGIMAKGKLRCVAPLQRLKSKFGGGYELSLQAADSGRSADAVADWVTKAFPSAVFVERTAAKFVYRLPSVARASEGGEAIQPGDSAGVQLADAFARLAECPLVETGELVHHGLIQLSLEQVFLRVSADADKEDARHHE